MSRQKGKPIPDPQCFQPLKINLHPPAPGHPLLWKNIVICVEFQHIAKSVDGCGNSKLDCHADQKLRKELLAEPKSYEISWAAQSTHLAKTQPTWEHWGLPSPSLPCTSSSRPAFQNPLENKIQSWWLIWKFSECYTNTYNPKNFHNQNICKRLNPPLSSYLVTFEMLRCRESRGCKKQKEQKKNPFHVNLSKLRRDWTWQHTGKVCVWNSVLLQEPIAQWTAPLFGWPPSPVSTIPPIFNWIHIYNPLTQLLDGWIDVHFSSWAWPQWPPWPNCYLWTQMRIYFEFETKPHLNLFSLWNMFAGFLYRKNEFGTRNYLHFLQSASVANLWNGAS